MVLSGKVGCTPAIVSGRTVKGVVRLLVLRVPATEILRRADVYVVGMIIVTLQEFGINLGLNLQNV